MSEIILANAVAVLLVAVVVAFLLFILGSTLTMLEDLPANSPVRRFFHRFLSDKKKGDE